MLNADVTEFLDKQIIEYDLSVPMSEHTTFRIGGNADCVCFPNSLEQLKAMIVFFKETGTPYFVLGNGSNLLVSDLGIDGVVISLKSFCNIHCPSALEIECGAGLKLSKLCSYAMEHSLGGLEFAWGIPGTVGGAIYMNAGAYGSEISAVLRECTFIDEDGKVVQADVSALKLGYRTSLFTNTGSIIVSAKFSLSPCSPEVIRNNMDELMMRRRSKQPLDMPSAGSTFKRPVGGFAAALIDECGLKGASVGGAEVSRKHAGFIVNTGDATCTDVLTLIEKIKKTVFLEKSIVLETEVKHVGRC